MRRMLAALSLALVAAACGERTISLEDYDVSCGGDPDCMVIHLGGVCDCACTYGAINARDRAKYFEDRGDPECDVDCGPCPSIEAYCNAGVCAVRSSMPP